MQLADALGLSIRWLITGRGRKTEKDWPFDRVDRSRWDATSDEDRGYLQAAMNRALDECEAGGAVASAAQVPAEIAAIWHYLAQEYRQTWIEEGRALLPKDSPIKV